jgi:hypothetical protein
MNRVNPSKQVTSNLMDTEDGNPDSMHMTFTSQHCSKNIRTSFYFYLYFLSNTHVPRTVIILFCIFESDMNRKKNLIYNLSYDNNVEARISFTSQSLYGLLLYCGRFYSLSLSNLSLTEVPLAALSLS